MKLAIGLIIVAVAAAAAAAAVSYPFIVSVAVDKQKVPPDDIAGAVTCRMRQITSTIFTVVVTVTSTSRFATT